MRGSRFDQGAKEHLPLSNSWTVPVGPSAIRLDVFVRRCFPHLSLREAQRAIKEKAFWVNDRPGRKGDKLFGGDIISLKGFQHLLAQSPTPTRNLRVPILYEDEYILVVDKPAGISTHGFSGRQRDTLANFLVAIRPSLLGVGKSRWEPGLLHRLDRDTSGLLLVAKDQSSFENLRSQFRRGLIKKKYWALVWGKAKREGIIDRPLVHDPADRRRMKIAVGKGVNKNQPKRWRALTRYRVIDYSPGFSLLEVSIDTGVTHQIRTHLEAVGHPLIGDPLYDGGRPDPFGLGRQFLHAGYLGFHHPKSGKEMTVESLLPGKLSLVLDGLKMKL